MDKVRPTRRKGGQGRQVPIIDAPCIPRPLLQIDPLRKPYAGTTVVDGVSLTIAASDCLDVIGPQRRSATELAFSQECAACYALDADKRAATSAGACRKSRMCRDTSAW